MPDLQQLLDLFRRHKHDGRQDVKLNDGVRDVSVSFETGEQAAIKLYFPYAVQILKIRAIATKAIAGTDNATITGANSTGNSTGGVITFTASDAINTEKSASPTDNNKVGKNDYYKLTMAKTTAGGKAHVSIEFDRL